jgi:ubiquitin C-terminal hydrolase
MQRKILFIKAPFHVSRLNSNSSVKYYNETKKIFKEDFMKTYINPQPQAVEVANKIPNKSAKNKKIIKKPPISSQKELYQNESEEQAWKDDIQNK